MNEEKIKLYFHVGAGKTGTSVIQSFFNENRKVLADKCSLLYPNFVAPDFLSGDYFNHAPVLNKDRGADPKKLTHNLKRAFEFCEQNNISRILLSWENKSVAVAKLIEEVCKRLSISPTIIVYIRRQDLWLESAWKQWGHKSPDYSDIDDYVKNFDVNWYNSIQIWSNYFGKNSIIVRPYEASQLSNGLISDFLSIFKIKEDYSLFKEKQDDYKSVNSGFSSEVMKILTLSKGLNRHLHDNALFNMLAENLPTEYLKPPFKSYGLLSKESREYVLERYSESNKMVAKEFLNKESGILFEDPVVFDENSATDELSLDKVIPIFMSLIFSQHKKINRLEKLLEGKKKKSIYMNSDSGISAILISQGIRKQTQVKSGLNLNGKGRVSILINSNQFLGKTLKVQLSYSAKNETHVKLYASSESQSKFIEKNKISKSLKEGTGVANFNLNNFKVGSRLRLDFIDPENFKLEMLTIGDS